MYCYSDSYIEQFVYRYVNYVNARPHQLCCEFNRVEINALT